MTYIQSVRKKRFMQVSSGLFADWRFQGDTLDSSPNGYHLTPTSTNYWSPPSTEENDNELILSQGNVLKLANAAQNADFVNLFQSDSVVVYMNIYNQKGNPVSSDIISISGDALSGSSQNILFVLSIGAYEYLYIGGQNGSNVGQFAQPLPFPMRGDGLFAVSKEPGATGGNVIYKMYAPQGLIYTSPEIPNVSGGSNAILTFGARNLTGAPWTGALRQVTIQDHHPGDSSVVGVLNMT